MPLVAKPRQKRGSAPRACLRQMTGISRNRALCKHGVPSAPARNAGPVRSRRRDARTSGRSHVRMESAPNIARSRPLWACAKTLTRVMVSRGKPWCRTSPSTATSTRPRAVLGLVAPTLQSKAGATAGPWRLGLCPRVGWPPLSCADRIEANGRLPRWIASHRRRT